LGSYAPERVLSNRDLEQIVDTSDDWIFSRTGIRERRLAAPGETTADLGYRAAERALLDSGLAPDQIDLVIAATITQDQPFPATANAVQHRIGARNAAAFELGAACAGFIYGLAAGAQFIQSGLYRHVLVVGAERVSKIINWADRGTCVLFGDGAGAVVLGPATAAGGNGAAAGQTGFLSFDLGSDGAGGELLAVNPGGQGHPLVTGSADPLYQSIEMSGSDVYKFAVRVIDESTRRALQRAHLSIADVDLFVPHQANIRIIEAAAKRLDLPPDRVFSNVHRYGNTSSASIPLALDEARLEGKLREGQNVVLVGFGAGLCWGSCVVRWGECKGVGT
jgi:3-oxoacyl-[acyl-carrier-protein] synthase-3